METQETKDGLPAVDYTEIDIPPPEPGGVHASAIRAVLGEAGARELLLASEVAQLRQAFAAQRLQVDMLKAKVKELEGGGAPTAEEPSPEASAVEPAPVAAEEPVRRPVGYASPYAANGASGG